MPIPTAKWAAKRAKLRTKPDGSSVVLRWNEWPNGKPEEDLTTGAVPVTDDATKAPEQKTATIRAFVHFIQPVTSGSRIFTEVAVGDAIVDFPLDLLRVTDPGDTSLADGQVIDEIGFSQANAAIADGEDSATADAVEPSALENLSMTFAGYTWVQKSIGEELANAWDAMYANININRAMLMTKS